MVIALLAFSIIIFCTLNKIKQKNLMCLIALCILVIIMAGDYCNPDYANYESAYLYRNAQLSNQNEWLYHWLQTFFYNKLNFSYGSFRLCITGISFLLIFSTCKKYVKHIGPVFLLFTIFPFFYESTVFRNFASLAIIIFAFRFLTEFKVKNAILYILCVVCASGIHYSSIAYILLLLVYFMDDSKVIRRIVRVAGVIAVLTALMPSTLINLLNKYIYLLSDDRASKFTELSTNYGFLIWWAFQIVFFLVSSFGKKTKDMFLNENIELLTQVDGDWKCSVNLIDITYYVSLICFLLCPLYRVHAIFIRVLFGMLFFLYVQYGAMLDIESTVYGRITIENRFIYYKYMVYGVCVLLFFEIFVREGLFQTIIMNTLTHNWIVELLF